ncbi:reverse transcriptase domain-containing protein [Tanacetum coccineum]
MTPPLSFSTPPPIPNINTNERPPVTTTVFTATTPGNTLFAYRVSTSTDPTPVISPAFVEANYEILESLLRDRRRQIRNEDLRTELEYFSKDYDEERKMEPRPERTREVTPPLRTRSPMVRRQRERVVGFEEASNKEGSKTGRNTEGNPSVGGTSVYLPQGGYVSQTSPSDPTGYVTLFVCWIEDYPLLDGLKMPSHIGSYDEKGDPDNFLHLFEGAIHMQKWLMPVASSKRGSRRRTWPFTASNKEKAIVSELSPLAREVATNEALNDRKDNFERSRKSSEDNGKGHKSRDRFSPYRGPNHRLLSGLSKSPREILAIEKIEEAVKSGQLFYLVKGIKKERAKTSDSQRGEKKEKSTTPVEAPILMINQEEARTRNSISKNLNFEGREIIFPPVMKGNNSLAPVVIEAKIFRREVGWVHMDSGSSCEVIYEHCFLKLKPSIQASKVDSQVPLVGFSGEKSWAIGEVLLEVTIGDAPLSRSETLNFIIVRSNSPYNMLLGRTAMQKMGMVVSTIHGAVKFYTTKGIKTVFSTHESDKIDSVKKIRETSPANTEGVLSCTDTEEKIIVNNKYPEQTVTIRKQLPEHFKERLLNLLRTNAYVFAWTHVDMTRIPRTITVNRKPFNTEHKLNEYSHIKPIKQKSLPQRLLSSTRDRLEGRVPLGILPKVFPGRLQRLPSDSNGRRRRRQDSFLRRRRSLLLSKDALRFKKRRSNVSKTSRQGHLITKQGIRANLSKVKAITDTEKPKTLKDIQSLNGKLAALSRFLSKGDEKSLPFFKVLKSYTDKKNIQWTQEAASALQEMKKFVETLPTITAPIHVEVLIMYLATLTEIISATLFGDSNKEAPKDFLIEAPPKDNRKEVGRKADTKLEETKPSCEWKLYTDGASSSDGSGAGLMLIDPEGKEYTYALRLEFETMNNESEYEALLAGLRIAQEMEIVNMAIFVDSQLLNKKADALSKLASMTFEHLTKEVLVDVLARRSIEEKEVLQVKTKEEESWMTPIHEYLLSGLLPEDSKESRKIIIKAPQYKLIRGSLYKKSFYTPWLHYIAPPKTDDVIKEIHEGSCGFNTEPRSMVVRITKQGFIGR